MRFQTLKRQSHLLFRKVHSMTKLMHDLFYALYGLYREAYMAYLLPKRHINNLLRLSAHGA